MTLRAGFRDSRAPRSHTVQRPRHLHPQQSGSPVAADEPGGHGTTPGVPRSREGSPSRVCVPWTHMTTRARPGSTIPSGLTALTVLRAPVIRPRPQQRLAAADLLPQVCPHGLGSRHPSPCQLDSFHVVTRVYTSSCPYGCSITYISVLTLVSIKH